MAKVVTLPHKAIDYQLFADAYKGVGGFEDGTYLKKHERESDDKYAVRQQISYFLNYVKTTIDSHVNPIFKKPVARDFSKASKLFQEFAKNVDGNNTTLTNFMKIAALCAKQNGCALIVMDNYVTTPQTQAEAIAGRLMPYVYVVAPSAIVYYDTEHSGELKELAYKEINTETGETKVKVWTKNEWYIENTGARGEHKLGAVPIVILKSRLTSDTIPSSEFNQIVKTNLSIFNKCSWKDEILKNQTFPILLYPEINTTDLTLGTDNALRYDGETSKFEPSFTAPPSDPAKLIMEDIDKLIQEIYRQAALSHVTGVESSKSGVAKGWDYETTNMVLADFAGNLEQAETQMSLIFQAWTGETFEYTVNYPRDFGIMDIAEELKNAEVAVTLGFGSSFAIEVCKKIVAAYFPKITESELAKILSEVEAASIDKAMSANGNYIDNGDNGGSNDNGTA